MDLETEKNLQSRIKQLEKEADRLKKGIKNKKFGLVWMEVPEEFEEKAKNAMPVLKEVSEKEVINKDGKPTHILIEGDNYHALTCLNYTHKGKIDVIYIDPPYNTGAKDWRYNNKYVEDDDPWRHSKWINFMSNRLRLAKRLLKKDGVLICTIDENEHASLGLLLQEIFLEREIVCVTIIHNPGGIQGNNFSYCHEYAYFVYPAGGRYINLQEREDNPDIRTLRNVSKGEHLRDTAANCFYPIYVKNGNIIGFGEVCPDSFHPKSANIARKDGVIEIYPIDAQNNERKWVFARQSVEEIIGELSVEYNKKRRIWDIIRKKTSFPYKTVWTDPKYNANLFGTQLLSEIIHAKFPFPKSLYAIEECIKAIIHDKDNAVILDFFAGSGTTGHAVLKLNKWDSGRRQFILCTNNENNICEDVTYPRVERVINGYKYEGKDKEVLYEKNMNLTALKKSGDILEEIESIKMMEGDKYEKYETKIEDNAVRLIGIKNIKGKKEGLGGSLKYYKTDFIGKNNVLNATDADKVELAHQAGELLAIAENTLYKIKENSHWQLYENGERYTTVYFREELDHFEKFVEMVEKLKKPVTVYVFSWGDDEFDDEFEHIEGTKVKTIPLPILEIYKNIYSAG